MYVLKWDGQRPVNLHERPSVKLQGITPVTDKLRILHFKTTDVLVIRQTKPLPDPEQPANGHRLIYYMLGGAALLSRCHAHEGVLQPNDDVLRLMRDHLRMLKCHSSAGAEHDARSPFQKA